MSLEVIAEGIELQQQLEILAQRGCHLGQGFLFSQALPENELRQKYLNPSSHRIIGEHPGFHFNFPELDS
jgi:EAL domain-containing protein (putative c-di-GMP-specific phosphodiesterase class I)